MLAFSLMLCANQAYADTEVREEKLLLPIQIDSHVEQIEALIVRPVKGEKFPIALIVNGTAAASPSAAHADWLAHIAHDFAHRGWLAASIVWPGYGRSTGRFMDEAGTCANPDVARFLDAHGKELGAALASLRERPDVDPSLVLGLGISIGGASMLDLAAQPGRPLSAVINISGGVYHYTNVGSPESDCSLYQADLLRNLMKFGKDNPTPTIWIYADNDPFFNPDLVARMVASYRSQGGNADVVTLPAFGNNGHTLYKQDANPLLKPHIEDFLRKNRFPAMDDSALTPLFLKLASRDRASAKAYLKSVTEKAMAMPTQGSGIFWYYGARSIQTARQQAISQCRKATGKPCRIVTENMELISGWQNMVPPSTQ
jgi:dienelactone hydrolase